MQNVNLTRTCTWSLSFHENNFYPGDLAFLIPVRSRAQQVGGGRSAALQRTGQEELEEGQRHSGNLFPFTGNREGRERRRGIDGDSTDVGTPCEEL